MRRPNPLEELTDEQIQAIKTYLKQNCGSQQCIPRSKIFNELKSNYSINMSEARFCQVLTAEVADGSRLSGFQTRRGRFGGICRAGAFAGHDRRRASENKRAKRKYTWRRQSGCEVFIGEDRFCVEATEAKIISFIVTVAGGSASVDGKVTVGTKRFNMPDPDLLRRFFMYYCGACPGPAPKN